MVVRILLESRDGSLLSWKMIGVSGLSLRPASRLQDKLKSLIPLANITQTKVTGRRRLIFINSSRAFLVLNIFMTQRQWAKFWAASALVWRMILVLIIVSYLRLQSWESEGSRKVCNRNLRLGYRRRVRKLWRYSQTREDRIERSRSLMLEFRRNIRRTMYRRIFIRILRIWIWSLESRGGSGHIRWRRGILISWRIKWRRRLRWRSVMCFRAI